MILLEDTCALQQSTPNRTDVIVRPLAYAGRSDGWPFGGFVERQLAEDERADYEAWLASPSVSTPDSDEMLIAFKLAKRSELNPTRVIRALRGQRGQEAIIPLVEAAIKEDPDLAFVIDGRVRRAVFAASGNRA
ncbi:MAG: hypothetical protein ACT452_16340, partial [Microthrixaceae bacterium]